MQPEKDAWFKFFPNDWLGDLELRRCSAAARGLWIDMISLMHKSTPYGHLTLDVRELANYTLLTMGEAKRLLGELEGRRVFSRTDEGIIFSRKMVRDNKRRVTLRANGVLGDPRHRRALPPQHAPPTNSENRGTNALVSGSGSLASEESSAQIPTVAEVIEFGNGPAAIPADYCEYYHSVCCEKTRWLVAGGRLLLWKKEIVRWWAGARPGWRSKKNTAADDGEEESIRAEMQWQKDPARMKALMEKLRDLKK